MEAVDVRGRFVWHQLMTRDVPGAKKFYSKLASWKTMPWPLDPAYTVCHADVGPVAGIAEMPSDLPAEVPPHWLQYIGTRDVDGTADAAVRAGGSIVKAASDMQGAGRYAVLQDPQGAVFAIIDPENARPEGSGPPALGTFSWHELATTDNEAAFAFYSGLFGWDAMQRMDMGPNGIYLIFGQNGAQRGGIYIKPAAMPGPAHWLPYASVPSADKGFALATASGARELVAPMDVPGGGRIAVIMDPAGAAFAIHSMPAAPAAAAKAPAKPKAKAKAKTEAQSAPKPKAKAKATIKAKAKPAPKPKAKVKAKAKAKAKKKPAAKKKVVRKATKMVAKKAAKKAGKKKSKAAARRKK
jgi:predicted enzyme related to lactoylglutathione lyase